MVVDSDAILRRVGLLFLMRMRYFVTLPVVVRLGIEVIVASVVLYTLMRMRVRMPVSVGMAVGHRSPLCA